MRELRETWWIGRWKCRRDSCSRRWPASACRRSAARAGASAPASSVEMVSCAGLDHGNERTLGYLRIAADEHPSQFRSSGRSPADGRAARMVEAAGADLVDINFGCPVRKVTKTGAGATPRPRGAGPRVSPRRRRRVGGVGAGLGEDAARARGRLPRVPRRRAAAGRGRRALPDAASSLRTSDVHRPGGPLADRRAGRPGRRAGRRIRRRHLSGPGRARPRRDGRSGGRRSRGGGRRGTRGRSARSSTATPRRRPARRWPPS